MPDWLIAAMPCLVFAVLWLVVLLVGWACINKPKKTRYSQWIE